jgi:hypothetical protein
MESFNDENETQKENAIKVGQVLETTEIRNGFADA